MLSSNCTILRGKKKFEKKIINMKKQGQQKPIEEKMLFIYSHIYNLTPIFYDYYLFFISYISFSFFFLLFSLFIIYKDHLLTILLFLLPAICQLALFIIFNVLTLFVIACCIFSFFFYSILSTFFFTYYIMYQTSMLFYFLFNPD